MHEAYIREVPGSRKAVLLVHGIVSTPRMFDGYRPLIPADWSVHNLLLAGHGGSVKDFGNTSMAKWKAPVKGCLSRLCEENDRVVVIAHSMGTLLTLQAAEGKPQVKGMVLLDVPLRVWVSPSMALRSLKFALLGSTGTTETEKATYRCIGVALNKRLWEYLGWLPRFWELLVLCREVRKQMPQPPCLCAVFHGRHDELVRRSSASYFRDKPWAKQRMLPGSGHFYFPPEDRAEIEEEIRNLFTEKTTKMEEM